VTILEHEKLPQRQQKRKRFKLPRVRLRFWLFWMVIFGVLVGFIVGQAGRYNDLRANLNRIQTLVAEQQAISESLYLQLTFFDSDAYIERLARERLGMIRPNEIVFRNIAAD